MHDEIRRIDIGNTADVPADMPEASVGEGGITLVLGEMELELDDLPRPLVGSYLFG